MQNYKFKKVHKRRAQTPAKNLKLKNILNPTTPWSLKSYSFGLAKENHVEIIRRFLARQTLRKGLITKNMLNNVPMTKKASQSRMGKGCGKIKYWLAVVRSGQLLFQVKMKRYYQFKYEQGLRSRLHLLNQKLPFQIKLAKTQVELANNERRHLFIRS